MIVSFFKHINGMQIVVYYIEGRSTWRFSQSSLAYRKERLIGIEIPPIGGLFLTLRKVNQ